MNRYDLKEFFSQTALFIFPTFVLVNHYISGFTFVLVMIFSCIYLVMNKGNALRCSRSEAIFFLSLSLLATSVVISAVVNEVNFERLGRLTIPVLAIPIYYWYRNKSVNEGALWFGLVCGAIAAGISAIYQILVLDLNNRAGGVIHPITFGDISLVMGFMSVAGSGWFLKHYKWGLLFPVLGLAFGLLASILSESRGGWLAFPAAFGLFAWFSLKHISMIKLLSVLVLILVALSVIYNTPQFKVKDRVNQTVTNLGNYIESNNVDDAARRTSLGIRLEMWKVSWYIFRENPLLGVGWDSYSAQAKKYVSQGLVSKNVAGYPHPHNQFLSALAKGGLLGLLAIILLIGVPLVSICHLLMTDDILPNARRICMAGLVFLLSYIAFALTEAVFERYRLMTFFAFYVTVLMALLQSTKNPEHKHHN